LRGPIGRSPVGAPRVPRVRAGGPRSGAGRRLRSPGRADGDEPRPRRDPRRAARGAARRRDDVTGHEHRWVSLTRFQACRRVRPASLAQKELAMRQRYLLVTVVILLGLGCVYGSTALAPARAADGDTLPGTATLTGVVNAPKPFKAARVHLMNVDKNVLFMVYTSGGRYRAVNLFPGNYEVTVRADGLAGNPQKIELAAGAGRTVEITLREGAALGDREGEFGCATQRPGVAQRVAYGRRRRPAPGPGALRA